MKNKPRGKVWLLLEILLNGENPSTMELVHRLDMTRPGSTKHYLMAALDVPIETEMILQMERIENKFKFSRFARYRITRSLLNEQRARFGLQN